MPVVPAASPDRSFVLLKSKNVNGAFCITSRNGVFHNEMIKSHNGLFAYSSN
jgi:hypothetical protein